MAQAAKRRFLHGLAMAALLSAGPAAALDFSVTRNDDPAPNGCQPGDCSVREAVLAANASPGADRVLVPNSPQGYGLFRQGANEDAGATGDLDIVGELEIVGAGAVQSVIAQIAVDRVVHVQSGGRLTLRGVTLQGGRQVANGGGVYVPAGRLQILASTLQQNSAIEAGGAVYLRSQAAQASALEVDASTFADNAAGVGGALYLAGHGTGATTARIAGSTVRRNSAVQKAGAVMLEGDLGPGSTIDVRDVDFIENQVTATAGVGGAFVNGAVDAVVRVRDSSFVSNRALGSQGIGGAAVGLRLIERTRFTHNSASVGGALRSDTVDIVESEFCGNLASRLGGAIAVNVASVHASTFCANEVTGSEPGEGGGAIYIDDVSGALGVSRSTFDGNIAVRGGAVLQRGGDLSIVQSTLVQPEVPPPPAAGGTLLRYEGSDPADSLFFVGNLLRGTCNFELSAGLVDSASHNVAAPGDSCGLLNAGGPGGNNRLLAATADLPLLPLEDNGGPTRTRAPFAEGGHPAVDHLPDNGCSYAADQRGYLRNDTLCDAGALEVGGLLPPEPRIFADGFEDD